MHTVLLRFVCFVGIILVSYFLVDSFDVFTHIRRSCLTDTISRMCRLFNAGITMTS